MLAEPRLEIALISSAPVGPHGLPDRYRAVRRLGEGGMGEVWQVEDQLSVADVPREQALKVLLPAWAGVASARFATEFRLLASLRHPLLARVFDYGTLSDGRAYYTAELVTGRTLAELAPTLDVAGICRVVAALCRVLDYLAARGLVHNDVKPSNVVVSNPPDGLKLLDFGVAGLASNEGELLPGTPPYMSPERLRGEPHDHRSDIYALGVTAYRLLTGVLPFEHDRPTQLLDAIAAGCPPARVLRPDLPPGLDEILRRMMAPDPRDRPSRAAEVIELLQSAGLGHFPLETPGTREAYALATLFVGRQDAISGLEQSVAEMGRPGARPLAVVRAPAGAGKSRLLAEVRLRWQLEGHRVVQTRCAPGAAPFAPVLEILDLGRGGAEIPPPTTREPLTGKVDLTGEAAQAHAVDTVVQSWLALARRQPLIAIIDDLEWADAGTLRALAAVGSLARSERLPLLVVAAARDERVAPDLAARLGEWAEREWSSTIDLPPLGLSDLRRLLDSLFGPGVFDEVSATEILRRSGGVALIVEAIVRALLHGGGLAETGPGWRLRDGSVEGAIVEAGESLRQLFRDRIAGLPQGARSVARALAVVGVPVPLALAEQVAGRLTDFGGALGDLDADGVLLREAGLAGAPARVGLFHDAFAEQVLADLEPSERRVLHVRAAEALEAASGDASAVARHFLAADDAARGFPRALRAGLRAIRLGDFRAGRELLEGAQRLAELAAASDADRARLTEGLADALAVMASAEAAAPEYERALGLVKPDSADAYRLIGKAAFAQARSGRYEAAERWASRAPGEPPLAMTCPELESVRLSLLLHRGKSEEMVTACRRRLAELDAPSRGADRRPLRRDVEIMLGLVLIRQWHYDEALDHYTRALAIVRELGDVAGEARVENGLAIRLDQLGKPAEAAAGYRRCLAIAARTGDRPGEAIFLVNLAVSVATLGQYDDALDLARRAIAQRARVDGDVAALRLNLGAVHFLRGEIALARSCFESFLSADSADQTWEMRSEAAVWMAAIEYLAGDAAGAGRRAAMAARAADASGDDSLRAMAEMGEAFACAAAGRTDQALALLRAARVTFEAKHVAVNVAASFYGEGDILARAGRLAEAAAAFEAAAARWETIGNRTEVARARQRADSLAAKPPEDAMLLEMMQRLGPAASEIGRHTERAAIAAALCDAAASVLGASRVMVVEREGGAPIVAASHGDAPRLDEALSGRVDEAFARPGVRAESGWLTASVAPEGFVPFALCVAIDAEAGPGVREASAVLVEVAGRAFRGAVLAAAIRSARRATSRPGASEASVLALTARTESQRSQILELTIGMPTVAGNGIVGESAAMQDLRRVINAVASRELPVLITGETGTGKELVARAVHDAGARAAGPFVAVNCASIAAALAESELFGHVRGAFTGASTDRTGFFADADGGTLFLDEIGELDLKVQAKLLRVLEDGVVRPLGGRSRRKIDVRVVAATNRDLEAEMRAGRFREDLYYRLSGIEIRLPPLRERRSDIRLLVGHLLGGLASEDATRHVRITEKAIAALDGYAWPGNVRELENELQRARLMASGKPIGTEHLSTRIVRRTRDNSSAEPARPAVDEMTGTRRKLRTKVVDLEREAIVKALARSHGNKSHAATALGIGRHNLRVKMKRYAIPDTRAK